MESLALIFLAASSSLALPPGLLDSVCWIESNHRPSIVTQNDGRGASVGACQIKASTAKWLGFQGTESDLLDPKTNIHWAGRYLAYQLKRYKGDVKRAVCAYNRGRSTGNGDSKYSRKVLRHWHLSAHQKRGNGPGASHRGG